MIQDWTFTRPGIQFGSGVYSWEEDGNYSSQYLYNNEGVFAIRFWPQEAGELV